jgi:hypothetical protein
MNMSTADLESRLKRAAAVAAPPRSIVDDVMQQLASSRPDAPPRRIFRHPLLVAGIAALGGAAAIVAIVFFLSGSVSLSLADVQKAFEGQRWVHIHFDVGEIKDRWTDLQTGESYMTGSDGDVVYLNERTNTRLWYWKHSGIIDQHEPTRYPAGEAPPSWKPQTAWDQLVAPLAQVASATQPAGGSLASVVAIRDVLNGKPAIRFDSYGTDAIGTRFMYSQLWADPQTHLPVSEKIRLQSGDRERYGKQWSTGDYDFPVSGPADLYALGVPRKTPIHKEIARAPAGVEPIVAAINRAHDEFLKNYRAVVWTVQPESVLPIAAINVIWRDDKRLRDDRFLPTYSEHDPLPTLPDLQADALFAWTGRHEPVEKQLMGLTREYHWVSTLGTQKLKPTVYVRMRGAFPLLAQTAWPENIQWPTRYGSLDFQILEKNAEMPVGSIGLRQGGDGNWRGDYYVDPANDYLCVKQVNWTRRNAGWEKSSQTTLTDLHRIAGHVVAGIQTATHYDDPATGIRQYTQTTKIQLQVVSGADYPPGTFDPKTLTTGATMQAY